MSTSSTITESFRIRQEEAKFNRRWRYRTARSDLSTVAYPYRETAKDILYDYKIITSPSFQPDSSEPQRLILPQETDGLMVNNRVIDEDLDVFLPPLETIIPQWLQQKRKPDNYRVLRDLTVNQMRDIDEALGVLMNRGRGELHALRTERAATIEKTKNLLLDTMETLPDYKLHDHREKSSRLRSAAESYMVSNLMIDRIAAEADGNPMLQGKEMGELQRLIGIIRTGEVNQHEMLGKFRDDTRQDFIALDAFGKRLKKEFGSKYFSVDGAPVPDIIVQRGGQKPTWDADMLVSVFFNMGNRDNLYTLQQGLGLSDEHLAALSRLATVEEWKAVEHIGQQIEEFVRKLGATKYRYLREWTNRMARPDKGRNTGANQIFGALRGASTVAALGLNIKSALRQTESFGIAADIMSNASSDQGLLRSSGWYWLVQGFKTMGFDGFLGGWIGHEAESTRRMYELSPEAKMRAKNINKDIRDMVSKTDPTRRSWTVFGKELSRDLFFHFTYAMDAGVAGVCFWGAYHQAKNGAAFSVKGMTDAEIETKAVEYANNVLRSQQSPFQADYTALQSDPGPWSLFTQFMGGVTPYLSHTVGMTQAWRRGQRSNMAMVRHLVNVHVLPTFVKVMIFDVLARALFGGDDDDDELSIGKELAWGTINSLTAPLPGVRDAVGVVQYGERSAVLPSIAAPVRAGRSAVKGAIKLTDGDTEAAAADFGRAVAPFVPLATPARQVWQAGEAVGIIEKE